MVDGDDLWVLCMGNLQYGEDGLYQATEAGGLVRIIAGLKDQEAPQMEAFALDPAGSPGSWAWLESHRRVVLGSSIVPELYVFDLEQRSWLFGPDNPLEEPPLEGNETLGVVAHPDGHVAVFSLGRNTAKLLDGETFQPLEGVEEVHLAVGSELEGPLSAVFVLEDEVPVAYVVLSLSNSLARWVPDDPEATDPRFRSLGLTPNQVIAHDTTLFVVESGDNVLSMHPLTDGSREEVVFPVGTNPYSAALSPDGTLIYVTGLLSNSLFEVDIESSSILRSGPVEP
jgi:hypothetical protein